jgi:hypothetical protein
MSRHTVPSSGDPSRRSSMDVCRRANGHHRQRVRARSAAAKAARTAAANGAAADGLPRNGAASASAGAGSAVNVLADGVAAEDDAVAAAEWRDLDVPQFHQVCRCLRNRRGLQLFRSKQHAFLQCAAHPQSDRRCSGPLISDVKALVLLQRRRTTTGTWSISCG